MRENILQFTYTKDKPTGVYLDKKDTFKAGKSKKHVWLQRLCFRILAKLEAYDTYPEIKYETITIDKKGFIERFLAQQQALIRDFGVGYNERFKLLIGARDYQELMGSPDIRQMLTFVTEGDIRSSRGRQIMSMEVTIVPWMTGTVVLPRGESNE